MNASTGETPRRRAWAPSESSRVHVVADVTRQQHVETVEIEPDLVEIDVLDQAPPLLRIGQAGETLVQAQRRQGLPGGRSERQTVLQAEEPADAARGRLRTDARAGGVLLVHEVDHRLVQGVAALAVGEAERDVHAVLARQFTEPGDFASGIG